jgi:hypothetical protein
MARRVSDAKTVVLLDPNGNEYRSNSPSEMSRLHYGQGYTFRDHGSWAEAVAELGDNAAVMHVPSHAAPSGAVEQTNLAVGSDVELIGEQGSTTSE